LPYSWTHLSPNRRSALGIQITLFDPIPLSRIVLQCHTPSLRSNHSGTSESNEDEDLDQATIDNLHQDDTKFTIFRQGETWEDEVTGRTFEILLTSPVAQGNIVQGETEIVVVPAIDKPVAQGESVFDPEGQAARIGGSVTAPSVLGETESSLGSRRVNPAVQFDPDNFLSASLFQERHEGDRDEEDEDELDEEDDEDHFDEAIPRRTGTEEDSSTPTVLSASSGSLTPRPFGSPLIRSDSLGSSSSTSTPSSIPHPTNTSIPIDHAGNARSSNREDQDDEGFQGVAFHPIVLSKRPRSRSQGKRKEGPNSTSISTSKEEWPDEDSKCWLSMSGLARAGVFVGDWVSQRLECVLIPLERG
jgi:hypothetical protein